MFACATEHFSVVALPPTCSGAGTIAGSGHLSGRAFSSCVRVSFCVTVSLSVTVTHVQTLPRDGGREVIMLWRQGDVFIESTPLIPGAAVQQAHLVLVEGELTGHCASDCRSGHGPALRTPW